MIDDSLLIKGIAQSDKKTIEMIYKLNYGIVEKFILKNNGTEDDARDIFQETMIILYENVQQTSFTLTAQLKTYIYSIAKRLWYKRFSEINKHTGLDNHIENIIEKKIDIEAANQLQEELSVMHQAIHTIGQPCQALLEAYYVEKKNMTDIATLFEYSNADTAKTQKYKCLSRLKRIFSELLANSKK